MMESGVSLPPGVKQVIRAIESSFASVVRPPPDEIVGRIHPMDFERAEAREFLKSRTWEELLDGEEWPIPTLLSPKAWHYYLPAYLTIGLYRTPPRFVIRGMGLLSEKRYKEFFQERLSLLDSRQRLAIRAYVECAMKHGSKDATDAWNQSWSAVE